MCINNVKMRIKKELCYLNNHFIDNLWDNYRFTKKKQVLTQKPKKQRGKVKHDVSQRDKVKHDVSMREKVVTKCFYIYHFSIIKHLERAYAIMLAGLVAKL